MRCAVVLGICAAACEPPAAKVEAPSVLWVYTPAATPVLGKAIATIGRSQAPQRARSLGIAGTIAKVPLRLATPFAVPGERARAVVYGMQGAQSAIELVDIDEGLVLWRDTAACGAPVVGVTESAIVCADANGVRGVGMDGKQTWKQASELLAMTGDRVVLGGADEVIVVEAESGDELARVKMPKGITTDSVLASCGDAGRELFASGQDGKLARIAEAKGGPAVAWSVPVGTLDEIDACDGRTVLVHEGGVVGGALVAIDRASGKITGRVTNVRGYWKARDGSGRVEIASDGGIARWPRDLAGAPEQLSPLVVGELLAERGELRLVRATPLTAVVLDREGVRAYLPFAAMGGALGDTAMVSASWSLATDNVLRRIALPERYRKQLRIATPSDGVAAPAELRDLPALEQVDVASAIAQPDSARHAVVDVAIDPVESAVLYTLHLEKPDDDTGIAGVAAVDLAKGAWRWQRRDACGTGTTVGLAVARDVIVCASVTRSSPTALVRATSRDGAARWDWESDDVDDVAAAGDAVLAFDGDVATVLDAATGKPRWRITTDARAREQATVVASATWTIVVAYEHGRVVARSPAGFPLWSIDVAGIVETIQPSAAGVIVTLEDGDAYRVELPSGAVHALPALGLRWLRASVVAGDTAGGPIPGTPAPPPPKPLRVLRPILERRAQQAEEDDERPRMWTPIPPPAPLGDSWQLTLYEPTGGLRARNDYGLFAPIYASLAHGPAGSPLVVSSGPGLREVLVIDPRDGDPLRRVQLPEDAELAPVFGTIVDGTPIAGAVLQNPLRVVIF